MMAEWLLGLTLLVGVVANAAAAGGPAEDKCDFTDGRCASWVTSKCKSGSGCFRSIQARNATSGPVRDHTSGTEDGWYGVATFPPDTRGGAKPAIIQTRRKTNPPFCFTGWYHVSGPQSPELTFTATAVDEGIWWEDPYPRVFLKAEFTETRLWQRVVYEEERKHPVTISISASRAPGTIVGLDDLSIVPGKCAPASVKLPNGTCPDEHVDGVRRLLMSGLAALDAGEQLPLRDVNGPAFALSAGSLSGLRFFNISGDVKSVCGRNESVTDFVAVVPRVRGHYTWRSRGDDPLSGELVIEGRRATFSGRLRLVKGAVRSASLAFSHFSGVSVHLDGVSSFSVPASTIMSLGNRALVKAVTKTTRDVVSPALKRALQSAQ